MRFFSIQHQSVQYMHRYVLACLIAGLLFSALLLLIQQVDIVATWDKHISSGLQQVRFAALDRVMLGITLAGDLWVAVCIMLVLVLHLLWIRRWWLAIHLSCVCLSALWAVSIIKSITARHRPVMFSGGVESFSFPSGHACTAAIVTGVIALLAGYQRTATTRYSIYGIAIVLTLLISFSRVYLLAHWPTDVLAGMALGFALVVAFGWQLHTGMTLETRTPLVLLALTSVAVIAGHLFKTYAVQASIYGVPLGS